MGKRLACGRARRRALLAATTLLSSGLAVPATAQLAGSQPVPPVRPLIDENGVDVRSGSFTSALADVAIGPDDHRGLRYDRIGDGATQFGSIEIVAPNTYAVVIGHRSSRFLKSGTTFASTEGDGATLTLAGGQYTYVARDGTKAVFASNADYSPAFAKDDVARLGSITHPDGSTRTFTWIDRRACLGEIESNICNNAVITVVRLQSVTNTSGHMLAINYQIDRIKQPTRPADMDMAQLEQWERVTTVTALNTRVQACDPSDLCTPLAMWPRALYAADGSATDALDRPIKSYVVPTFLSNGRVASATRDGITYSYTYADAAGIRTTTRTDPLGKTRKFESDIAASTLKKVTDELGHATSYAHDAEGRVTEITYPESNKVQFTYDARGNVLSTRRIAKPSWAQADIVTSATYAATCADPETCYRPLTTTDEMGKVTDYSYDPIHGGVTSVRLPAPTAGAARPETRYVYEPISGQYLMTQVSTCSTGSAPSCVGTADETRTTIAYGAAGGADAFLPVSVETKSGNGALIATTTVTYDAFGNATHVDGPLSGTADTTRTIYDKAGQVVGVIGPDPDGAGVMKHRAQRFTYNDDGLVTKVEEGTTGGQTDADWAAFSSLRSSIRVYGAGRRPAYDHVDAAGATHSLTQYAYDSLGRPECVAVRMNRSAYGPLPASACLLGPEGTHGPDRITRLTYSDRGEVVKSESGYGTTDVIAEQQSHQANGAIAYLTDGKGNRSYIGQDGHDRSYVTYYPSPSAPGTVNWADYEYVSLDARGNAMHRVLRDGQVIALTYDDLGRLTNVDDPASATSVTDTDVAYSYDNLGRLTQALDNNGHFTRRTWDALGRMTSEESVNGGIKTIAYDLAGRRTRLTWPDGLYVQYQRHADGTLASILENGTTVLASFAYDGEGRRTSLAYGNGTSTAYGYDAPGRLSSIAHDLDGTAGDVTFTYHYNPAGQIAGRTSTNAAYAWTGHGSGSITTGVDGRNFLTSVGGSAAVQDGRGNLTSDGSVGWGYNLKNQLVARAGVTQLYYEPLGRLTQQWNGGGTLDWVGDEIVAERNGDGTLARRHVHGDGVDDPLVTYEGAGTSDRRWLHADERGSIVALSDAAGMPLAYNRYDEYGRAASITGRFGYTGQAWLPQVGLYTYKARMYAPGLGRFMQADPMGNGDGLNMFGYVGGDPVNLSDPSGMVGHEIIVTATIKQPISASSIGMQTAGRSTRRNYSATQGSWRWADNRDYEIELAAERLAELLDAIVLGCGVDYATADSMLRVGEGCQGGSGVAQLELASQRKGERGATGHERKTAKPFKKASPVKGRPGYIEVKDPHTGRSKIKKAPADFPWDKFNRFGPTIILPPMLFTPCYVTESCDETI